jgi:hypothetical protein
MMERTSVLIFLLSILFSTPVTTSLNLNVYIDVPFPQLQSNIFQLSQFAEIAAWSQLPSDLGSEIQSVKSISSSASSFLLLGSEALYLFTPSFTPSSEDSIFVRLDEKLNISISTPMKMLTNIGGINGSLDSNFLVMDSQGFYLCDETLFSFCSHNLFDSSLSIGVINDLAVFPGGVLLGGEGGLFILSLMPFQIVNANAFR